MMEKPSSPHPPPRVDRLRNSSKVVLPCQSFRFVRHLTQAVGPKGQAYIREPHALVNTNCKILMCYSMLGISQQLLLASIMRPHYTLLD